MSGIPHGDMTQNRGDYKVNLGLTKEKKRDNPCTYP